MVAAEAAATVEAGWGPCRECTEVVPDRAAAAKAPEETGRQGASADWRVVG